MKKNKIKVGVIGGGIIGAGNILKGKQIKYVDEKKNKQSHSGVINSLRNFKLNFIVDNNINIIKKLKINYSCPIYSDIKEVPKDQYPDILTVCETTELTSSSTFCIAFLSLATTSSSFLLGVNEVFFIMITFSVLF